jgi:undecaprenyl-diphosphatase
LFASDAARRREAWEYAAKIIVSALPAVVVYGLFKDPIEELFENARMVGALLMFTGVVLTSTRFLPRGTGAVGFLRAFLMGCGQAVAILPGVSRSGMTLASARACRVAPEKAAEFSFLMSAPLIAGDALLHIWKSFKATPAEVAGEPSWGVVACGAVIAAVVGYFSLAILLRTLRGRWFWLFGPYCFTAGLLVICFCK